MPRDSDDQDFYDPDVPTDSDPSPLRRVILAQAFEPGGAVVVLHTPATLEAGERYAGPGGEDLAATVEATAVELELDPLLLELFTPDAYLLQSALGERLLPGDA